MLLLSIAPKSLLHDLFATHTDVVACNDADTAGPCIHKQGFSCQQSDIVVPSVYVAQTQHETAIADGFISLKEILYSSNTLTKKVSARAGRGPPAHV